MSVILGSTGITFPDSTTQTTAATSGGSGTVTSITAGTGLSGGTITTSGTIALVTTLGAVGTYAMLYSTGNHTPGATLAGSSLQYGGLSGNSILVGCTSVLVAYLYPSGTAPAGTWKIMGAAYDPGSIYGAISTWLRIA